MTSENGGPCVYTVFYKNVDYRQGRKLVVQFGGGVVEGQNSNFD